MIEVYSSLIFKTVFSGGEPPFRPVRYYDDFWKERLKKNHFGLVEKDSNPEGFLIKEIQLNDNLFIAITPDAVEIKQNVSDQGDNVNKQKIASLARIAYEGIDSDRIHAIGFNDCLFVKNETPDKVMTDFLQPSIEDDFSTASCVLSYEQSKEEGYHDKISVTVQSAMVSFADSAKLSGIIFQSNYHRDITMQDAQGEAISHFLDNYANLSGIMRTKVNAIKARLFKN